MAPKFIVDINVGRLATWLRAMGYDTTFPRNANDNELVRLALKEERILVTRDSGFLDRRVVRLEQLRLVYIAGDDLRGQLRQLIRELNLTWENVCTRCVRCNQILFPLPKSCVLDLVPKFVASTQEHFSRCAGCQRIYSPGTHWSNMIRELSLASQEE